MPELSKFSVVPFPPRNKPTAESFDTSAKAVQAWVAQLPMANLGQAAKTVFHALSEVNRLEIAPDARFHFMETIRDPVRTISEGLEKQFVSQTFPLATREQKIAALAREFQEEMALGYNIVVQALLNEHPGYRLVFHNAQLCVPVHRALRHMGQILLHCYQVYAPYPENTWREVHRLYRLAADIRCVNRPITDSHYTLIDKNTSEDAYKQVLLLALAAPYRLRPGEVATVHTALEQLSPHCRLSPVADRSSQPQGLFAVYLDSDQQPNYLQVNPGHHEALAWVLDTTPLGALLRRQLARLEHKDHDHGIAPGDLPREMSVDLLKRLMQSWGMMAERRFARTPGDGQAEVVLGISGAYRALGGLSQPDTASETDTHRQRPRLGHDDVTLEGHTSALWASTSPPRMELDAYTCHILDLSRGGYRLEWRGNDRVKLKIGNLIAIRSKGEQAISGGWALGLIRWLRSTNAEVLEFGVQLLASSAEPVLLRVCAADGRCGDFVEGFLVAAASELDQPAALLAPGFLEHLFKPAVVVSHGGQQETCRLTRVLESTGTAALFEYVVEKRGPASTPPREPGQTPGFDAIWDIL
jgi:hypothetical protein